MKIRQANLRGQNYGVPVIHGMPVEIVPPSTIKLLAFERMWPGWAWGLPCRWLYTESRPGQL